jgi:phage baseplate assembly protein V
VNAARELRAWGRRVALMLGRARLTGTDDAADLQRVQVVVLEGEVRGGVERIQQFGLSGHAPAGADVLVVSIGGNRDHPVAVAVDHRAHRPAGLQEGETAVYNAHQVVLTLHADGSLVIAAPTKVRIETPLLEVTGEVRDRCDSGGITMADMRDVYDAHVHGGVQPGGGQTDVPDQQMGG